MKNCQKLSISTWIQSTESPLENLHCYRQESLHNYQSPKTDRCLTLFKNNEKLDIIWRGGLDRTLSNLFWSTQSLSQFFLIIESNFLGTCILLFNMNLSDIIFITSMFEVRKVRPETNTTQLMTVQLSTDLSEFLVHIFLQSTSSYLNLHSDFQGKEWERQKKYA